MFAARLFLRRPPRIRFRAPVLGLRLQHDSRGPHKEYFQTPSQFPPASQIGQTPQSTIVPPVSPRATTETPPAQVSKQLGRIGRFVRAAILVDLFLLLGFAVGTAVITWEYIQPPYDLESEEYRELLEEIEEVLETSPIVEDLRGKGWQEGPIIRPAPHGSGQYHGERHLLNDTLSGVQGVTMKHFRHPDLPASTSALVFFAGFGVEGWPDTVHGGTITSMFTEAWTLTQQQLVQEEGFSHAPEIGIDSTGVRFLKPVKPGTIYTILAVQTGLASAQPEGQPDCYIIADANLILMDVDELPAVQTQRRDESGDSVTTVDPGKGVIHAAAKIRVAYKSNHIRQGENESLWEMGQRVVADMDRLQAKWFVPKGNGTSLKTVAVEK